MKDVTNRGKNEPPTAASSPLVQRLKAWTLFVSMLAGGGGIVWWSLSDLAAAGRRLARGAALLEWSSMDVRGLFAGLAVLVLALLCVPIESAGSGAATPRSHRRREPTRLDLPALLMGSALVLMLLCLAAPPIATVVVGNVLIGRGYRLCPNPIDEHRPPLRWAPAPAGRCPINNAEAREMMR